jgi:hypothetical protein
MIKQFAAGMQKIKALADIVSASPSRTRTSDLCKLV